MNSEAKVSKVAKWYSWMATGASIAVATIFSITNSEFVPRLALWGTGILLAIWISTWVGVSILRLRPAANARIVSPGLQVHISFVGAILALWVPLLFEPIKAQKVEIILDVSQRMGEEFDPPGTTKFDAARTGVLQVLGYLEGQNMEVALRLVNSSEVRQCVIDQETSLAVDFTRDLDKIRNRLDTIRPSPSDKAPVVNAIDFSIDHYLNKKLFDQKFYVYSFVGGDDTCGEKLGVYLDLPKVKDNAVNTDLFLVILLGTNQEIVLQSLPNAKLDYARSASQVQQIVQFNNQLIALPTPTSTSPPLFVGISGTVTATEPAPVADEQVQVPDVPPQSKPVVKPSAAPRTKPSATNMPSLPAPSMTLSPALPSTPLYVPSSTFTKIQLPIATFTKSMTPTFVPTFTQAVCQSIRPVLHGTASYGGTVTIDAPIDCTTGYPAETAIDTHGTYSNIPSETIVWVLVYPPNGLYYPQSPNACDSPVPPPYQDEGNWNVNTYLGTAGEPPKWFDIVVVLADQTASNFLGNWVHSGCLSTPPGFQGIEQSVLEQYNITEKDYITIQTR